MDNNSIKASELLEQSAVPFDQACMVVRELEAIVEQLSHQDVTPHFSVLLEVAAERQRQDGKWGGPDHDDSHSIAEFVQWIEDYAGWARMMDSMRSPGKARRRLIQISALAVAAVESIDRRYGKEQHEIKKKVYLSGPMTGIDNHNFPAFNAAANSLRALGLEVINPAEINADGSDTWHECMRNDIKALCDCDAIAMIPGWEKSNGAHLELHIAHRIGIEVTYVERLMSDLAEKVVA